LNDIIYDIIYVKVDTILTDIINVIIEDIEFLSKNPRNVKFNDLFNICEKHFPEYRNNGTSHFIFKTYWHGDPRINIQRDKNSKMAKTYQVRQVIKALEKLKELEDKK